MQRPRTTCASGSYEPRHQDARTRRGPRRRHAAGAAGAARPGLRVLEDRRTGAGAVDARPLHQAAPVEPGARLRALPARAGQLQRQPRHLRQPVAAGPVRARPAGLARRLPVVQAAGRAVPAVAGTRPMRECAWTTSSIRSPTYEVHVARYYFRRGAYVAAANRAQQAVQEFPQTPVDRRGAVHHGASATTGSAWTSCATTPSAC